MGLQTGLLPFYDGHLWRARIPAGISVQSGPSLVGPQVVWGDGQPEYRLDEKGDKS